jgi:hypothetical protein
LMTLFFLVASISVFAQTNRTVTTGGNWTTAGIWTGSSMADTPGENANFNNDIGGGGLVTLPSPQNLSIANLSLGNGNDLTIASGATLTIGNSSTTRNFTTGNDCKLIVSGTLIIWGDLDPGNNFSITVTSTGTLIIKDDFLGDGDSDITVAGTMDVDDDFVFGNNADFAFSGNVDIDGDLDFGNDADITLTSPGDLDIGGHFDAGNNPDLDIASGSSITILGYFDVGNDADVTANGGLSVAGDFTAGNNVDIDVGTNGTLFVGDDISFGNDGDVTVNGDMTVTDDFTSNNNLDLIVGSNGDFDIGGTLTTGNDGDIIVDGRLDIGDDVVGGNNTDFDVDGIVTIVDDITVGDNSNATGSGSILVGGSCSDGTSNFCGQGPMAVLPIKLIYFKGEATGDNNGVVLQWATDKEESFAYFEIEHATSDLQFLPIAQIPGAGFNSTSFLKYEWQHTSPVNGNNYYRLKAVDIDGSYEYFNVIIVSVTGPKEFEIYPNPSVDGKVNYKINFEFETDAKIIVLNSLGHALTQAQVASMESEIEFSEALKPGIYYVRFISNAYTKTIRLVVR